MVGSDQWTFLRRSTQLEVCNVNIGEWIELGGSCHDSLGNDRPDKKGSNKCRRHDEVDIASMTLRNEPPLPCKPPGK